MQQYTATLSNMQYNDRSKECDNVHPYAAIDTSTNQHAAIQRNLQQDTNIHNKVHQDIAKYSITLSSLQQHTARSTARYIVYAATYSNTHTMIRHCATI